MGVGFWVAATPLLATAVVGIMGAVHSPVFHRKPHVDIMELLEKRFSALEAQDIQLAAEIKFLHEIISKLMQSK